MDILNILADENISFLGIQVKFVNEESVNQIVKEALERMTFSRMFKKFQRDNQSPQSNLRIPRSDRAFGLVILALGVYNKFKPSEVSVARSGIISLPQQENVSLPQQDPFESPSVLVIKGIPNSTKELAKLFDDAPSDYSYRGISAEYLEECDRLYELMQEIVPSQQESKKPEEKYVDHKKKPPRASLRLRGDLLLFDDAKDVKKVKKRETFFFDDS